MAQKVIIAGAEFPDVPAVDLPKASGGMARFVDTSGDTVTAAHLEVGYTAHGDDGEPIQGELVPGGGAEVVPFTASANGTYTAPSGKAYSPVTVAIPTYDGSVS